MRLTGRLLTGLAAVLVGAALAGPGHAATTARNPIAAENALPGTAAWNTVQAPFRYVEGYASEVSVMPGETVHFHVQTEPAARYRIYIYRLGWYGGLGGRLMTCLPSCETDEQGAPQPVTPFDPATGLNRPNWPVTDTFTIPADWVSGYYTVRLILTTGPGSRAGSTVPLIVRALPTRASTILVDAPVNTWQAYDSWGGRSLYTFRNGYGSNRVAFDRPYVHGEQDMFEWEYQAVRYLEREGYDVSYTTDVDVDRDPGELLRHRLFMMIGHNEYWTKVMRDGIEAARDQGTNLAFLGGNTGYWQLRYEDNREVLVEYRIRSVDPEPNPGLKTTQFRLLGPPRPECEVVGVQWQDGIGFESDFPVSNAALGDPYFAGTGFTPNSVLKQLIGGEWDGVQQGCDVPTPTVLFHFPAQMDRGPADVTRYTAVGGARVFSGSSLRFSWGLDDWGQDHPPADPRLQRFMKNVLDDLTRPAAPTQLAAAFAKKRKAVVLTFKRYPDVRVRWIAVYRHSGTKTFGIDDRGTQLACVSTGTSCLDKALPFPAVVRYAAVTRDSWRTSVPIYSSPVRTR